MATSPSDPIRVFVGADRSQWLAARVLDHSIRQRTARAVEFTSMADLDLPKPVSRRNQPRTGFSFARFAIPALAGHAGRALYLDADMLVLRDLAELWDMAGRPVQIQGSEDEAKAGRARQCSVMLLDCGALDWNVQTIVAGLDGQYDYDQLMGQLCILRPEQIGSDVPFHWNSLDHRDATTGLLHYTDMLRQPWVSLDNPHRGVWIDELRAMLASGAVQRDEVAREIALGHARPSLLAELDGEIDAVKLRTIDTAAGFVPHGGFTAGKWRFLLARLKRRLFG